MPHPVIIAVGGGAMSAAVTLLVLSGSPGGALLGYLAPFPLMLVALALGAWAAPVAGVVGVALVAAFGGVTAASLYGGLHAVPSWLVAKLALTRRGGSAAAAGGGWSLPGDILCWLALLAASAILAAAVLAPAGIEQSLRQVLDQAFAAAGPSLTDAQRSRLVDQISPFFLGATGVMWIIMIAVNGVAAQGLLGRKGWSVRPTPRWSALALPDWFSWVLVAAAVVALFADGDMRYVARNLVLILATPYFFVGLAVVHYLAARTAVKLLALVGFYMALGFAFPGVGAAVAALGVAEQWIGVRRRLPRATPSSTKAGSKHDDQPDDEQGE